jgi:hypothetical protein
LRKNFKEEAIVKVKNIKNHRDNFINRNKELRHKFIERKKELADKFYSRLDNIQKNSSEYRETKDFLKLYDKLSFVVGVFLFGMFAYIMGRYPNDFFYTFYRTFIPLLLFIRFVDYKPKKLHYFLTDFCYWAGLMVILFVGFFPKSPYLYRIAFLYANGALAVATGAFNNAMIFH